jgi:excisionase family DNA binding protein
MTDTEILTRAEVAEILRCSAPQVVKLVRTKGLPGFQLGEREWRFRRRDVMAWVAEQAGQKESA